MEKKRETGKDQGKRQRTGVNSTLGVNNNKQMNPKHCLISYSTISVSGLLIFTPSCPTYCLS